jgi:hypothetical protein
VASLEELFFRLTEGEAEPPMEPDEREAIPV